MYEYKRKRITEKKIVYYNMWCFIIAGAYFMQSYSFKPEVTSDQISSALQTFITDSKLTSLGAWQEELGPNSYSNGKFCPDAQKN